MTRRTRAKDLRRRTATRRERRTVVVFCEGEASEPDYLRGVKSLPGVRGNTALTIEIDPRRDVPLPLVQAAVERSRDDEVDECWCIFDVEWPQNHPNLREAVALADAHGIRPAISNPCFELWLILHLDDHTSHLTTRAAERKNRGLDGRSGKRLKPDLYLPHRQIAARRAALLADRHQRDGTAFPQDNPSTTVYELIAAIEP